MFNGSLDADAMVYLAQQAEKLVDVAFCNELVPIMATWLEERQSWDPHFVFKDKHFDLDDGGLEYVARYYIMLARSEAVLWAFKCALLPDFINIESYWKPSERNHEDYKYLARMMKRLAKKTTTSLEPSFYLDGNTLEDLIHNYALSMVELKYTKLMLKAEIGFPTYHSYENGVEIHQHHTQRMIRESLTMVERRAQVLEMRLRYDCIQREIDALETA